MTDSTPCLPTDADAAALLLAQTTSLRALAGGLVGSQGAEDVVQDALLAGVRARPRNSGAWLIGVVRRMSANMRRSTARRRRRETIAVDSETSSATSTEHLVLEMELQQHIADAVLSLSETQREVIVMRYWHDLAPREIAVRLGLPVNTVKTRLQRAIANLRGELDGVHGDRAAWLVPIGAWLGSPSPLPLAVMSMNIKTSVVLGTVLCACLGLGVAGMDWSAWGGQGVEGPPDTLVAAANETTDAKGSKRAEALASESESRSSLKADPVLVDQVTLRVVEVDGTPIRNAQVTAVLPRGSGFVQRGAPLPAVSSDAQGRANLRIPRYAPGFGMVHRLRVAKAGRAPVIWDGEYVESDKKARDLDIGDITLTRGVAVHGRVVSHTGEPLDSGTVLLWDERWVAHYLFGARAVAEVQADGSFVLPHRLSACSSQSPYRLFVVSPTGIAAKRIEVIQGQEELPLQELRCYPSADLSIEVVDEADQPMPDARVTVIPTGVPFDASLPRDHQPSTAVLRQRFTATTGAAGGCRFHDLADPRSVELAMRKRSENQWLGDGYLIVVKAAGYTVAKKRGIKLDLEQETRVKIVMTKSDRAAISGVVRTADGTPVSGLFVTVKSEASESMKSGDSGEFSVPDMLLSQSRRVSVWVSSREYHQDEVNSIVLSPGVKEAQVDLTVWRFVGISGRVVDAADKPVANAQPFVRFVKGSGHDQNTSFSSDEPTDAAGRFTIANAIDDALVLDVRLPAPRHAWYPADPRRVRGGDQDLVVRLTRRPNASTRAEFDIVDADTGKPLAPIRCQLTWLDIDREIPIVESPGRIVVEHLCPGRYGLKFDVMDHGTMEFEFTVEPGELRLRRKLRIGQLATVHGVLHWHRPKSARSKPYQVRISSHSHSAWVYAGGDGTFAMERVPGAKRIRVYVATAEMFAEAFVTTPSGGEVQVDLHPQVGGRLRIRSEGAVWSGKMRLEGSTAGGPWRVLSEHRVKAKTKPVFGKVLWRVPTEERVQVVIDWTTPVVPVGEMRWRIRYVPGRLARPEDRVVVAEGTVSVKAGEVSEIRWTGR